MYRRYLNLCFALFLIGSFANAWVEAETFTIGVIASLTGKGAARGQSARMGLEAALAKFGSEFKGDKKIRLIYQDVSTNRAADGVSAFTHLSEVENVCAIIGPMGSTVASAVAPLAESRNIPIMPLAASAAKITDGTSYVFRMWPSSQQYADIILAELERRNWRRIAAITSEHENTVDLMDVLSAKLVNNPQIRIVSDDRISPDSTDFKNLWPKISTQEIDAVFLNLFEGQISLAARQGRQLGISQPYFTNAVMSSVDLSQAPEALDKIWFPRFETPKHIQLARTSEEISDPDAAAAAHDALMVLIAAFERCGCNRAKIAEFISAAASFDGLSGKFRFIKGDATVPVALYQVLNGGITIR